MRGEERKRRERKRHLKTTNGRQNNMFISLSLLRIYIYIYITVYTHSLNRKHISSNSSNPHLTPKQITTLHILLYKVRTHLLLSIDNHGRDHELVKVGPTERRARQFDGRQVVLLKKRACGRVPAYGCRVVDGGPDGTVGRYGKPIRFGYLCVSQKKKKKLPKKKKIPENAKKEEFKKRSKKNSLLTGINPRKLNLNKRAPIRSFPSLNIIIKLINPGRRRIRKVHDSVVGRPSEPVRNRDTGRDGVK